MTRASVTSPGFGRVSAPERSAACVPIARNAAVNAIASGFMIPATPLSVVRFPGFDPSGWLRGNRDVRNGKRIAARKMETPRDLHGQVEGVNNKGGVTIAGLRDRSVGQRAGAFVIVLAVPLVVGAVAFGQTTRTVRDGVYSEEQAKRGKTVYDTKCGACHDGSGMGPQLKDDAYLEDWQNKSVRALYSRVLSTMPENDPGSLTENEVLDVIAYLLQAHGFPAGGKALESASELDTLTFVRAK
jgi:mono/diheme cytochrome c family protein